MKLMIMPSSIQEVKDTLDYVDAYLIGIIDLCVNTNLCVNINELSDILKIIGDKELYISLNKNMNNDDIDILKDVMNKLDNYNIKGIFYYDVGVLNIYRNGNYKYELVFANEHATTNYDTIKYWHSFDINYFMISSDITIKDVYEIRKKTDCNMIVPIFGYMPMFNSKRHIVKNYLDYFNLKDNSKINFIEKENKIYPIVDNKLGTIVYTNYIINGFCEYNNLIDNGIDYILLSSFNIDSKKFLYVLEIVNNFDKDSYNKINELFSNCGTGFMYQDMIAKVKKDEK